ncbi:hypothetical protein [Riemerella anatipestifer]|uniref:Uncharacterized protein n=1 Tax=Riemerella anatipestifer TaxID=34085 RepID=A0AAP6LKJ3_RIEAN|nr:hypothetical protein [Riemerella anatipestifer]MCD5969356.1 hypothetical protein [Riemerella anatipestifer]MCO7355874.1 hypothetical protein [Riemerella anatipestifer]MCU7540624.1 hypothetical protein [Riemerella anatipestifer]MCU7570780.1 hypothetical protein [Riemerella anatipestifer]MCU7597725.1 hypothetical protein [Riemerella anatipestifer]
METLSFVLFILLLISLVRINRLKLYRKIITIVGVLFFGYWIFTKIYPNSVGGSIAIQLVNKHPQTLDFYSLEVLDKGYNIVHLEDIRSEHYRVCHLGMKDTDEFWLVAFSGKKMVYFTQHIVGNKNEDLYIEANNYLNQSAKLSNIAEKQIRLYKREGLRDAVWVTFCFLILFINIVSWVKKK